MGLQYFDTVYDSDYDADYGDLEDSVTDENWLQYNYNYEDNCIDLH